MDFRAINLVFMVKSLSFLLILHYFLQAPKSTIHFDDCILASYSFCSNVSLIFLVTFDLRFLDGSNKSDNKQNWIRRNPKFVFLLLTHWMNKWKTRETKKGKSETTAKSTKHIVECLWSHHTMQRFYFIPFIQHITLPILLCEQIKRCACLQSTDFYTGLYLNRDCVAAIVVVVVLAAGFF